MQDSSELAALGTAGEKYCFGNFIVVGVNGGYAVTDDYAVAHAERHSCIRLFRTSSC